jgi:spermidine synthase
VRVLTALLVLVAVLVPATVAASAFVKRAVGASAVEAVGFFQFLPAALGLLGPLCFVLGSVFGVGSRILQDLSPARNEVSRAYVLESAGAGAGGLIISWLAVPHIAPLSLSFGVAAVLLAVSLLLASRPVTRGVLGVLVALFVVSAFHPAPDAWRYRAQWHGLDLLEAGNSRYGGLAAIAMDGQVSLYENGMLAATSGYRQDAEELVHLSLAQHAEPQRVLLIGGGLGGCLQELLKHPGLECDYVELDPALVALARRRLPAEEVAPLADPRVAVHHVDGRYFVKHAPQRYDVVLLALPGPRSALLSRFYSEEFFEEARRTLSDEGVLAFRLAASDAQLAPEQARLLTSLRRTAQREFPHVALLPGDTCHFVLSVGPQPLTAAEPISERLDAAGIGRQYVTDSALRFRLSSWRAGRLEEGLAQYEEDAQINRDLRPLGYLYDLAEWSAQFGSPLRRGLSLAALAPPGAAYGLVAVVIVLLLAGQRAMALRGGEALQRFAVGAAVWATGASEIVFQMTVLVGFQVVHGYLFYRLGIMVAAFMAGLALGAFFLWRRPEASAALAWRRFVGVHMAIIAYPAVLPVVFLGSVPAGVYMLLPAVSGLIGGLEFPLAVRLWRSTGAATGKAAGTLYALDLLGACVGAALVTPLLIPMLGLPGICWWVVLLNAGTLLLLLLSMRRAEFRSAQ